jgi:hypothetical protein
MCCVAYGSPETGLLKGHGNEADFLGFLQKLVPHRSLTLPFEPFCCCLRIHGDNCNQKTTPRLGKSAFECLKENLASRRFPDSASRGVVMMSRGVAIQIFKIKHRFSEL